MAGGGKQSKGSAPEPAAPSSPGGAAEPAAPGPQPLPPASASPPEAAGDSTPLRDLATPQAGLSGEFTLKVLRCQIAAYTYPWQGKKVDTKKLVCVLVSPDAGQYCLGSARMEKKDEKELEKMEGEQCQAPR